MFNPISGKHSISKVVAAIHLPQELLMLEGLFSKLNFDSKISKKYQKRALTGENGHVDHPKTEYTDQLFSFA